MLERWIEKLLFSCRWLLAPIYLGMSLVLLALGYKFFQEVFHLLVGINSMQEVDFILLTLGLIDILLVGGLIVMVMFSSYENFVSKIDIDGDSEKLGWLGQLDAATLKLKVAASIVAISSIQLLKKFMNVEAELNNVGAWYANPLLWYVIIHLTFVISAVMMGLLDRMSFASHRSHHESDTEIKPASKI